ncbi:MAG TPA: energy transducer TonB [Candidatus Angelobacter sp.]
MTFARPKACWLLPLLFLRLSSSQEPPSVLRISAAAAEQNVIKKVEPVYPDLAKVAHIEGRVIIGIIISSEGKVVSERAITGHPLLIQPAMVAVKHWEYHPYVLEGQSRTVTAVVRVPFSLGHTPKEDPAFTAYDEQETKCQTLLDQQSYASASQACASLPELAEKANWSEATAYRLSGFAYFKASNFQDALVAWQHQLAITKGYKDNAGEGEAHFNVARTLQATGDLDGAKSHYERAVSRFEAAHHDAPQVAAYSENLRTVLLSYASLLRQIGDQERAKKLEEKAASLEIKPHNHK